MCLKERRLQLIREVQTRRVEFFRYVLVQHTILLHGEVPGPVPDAALAHERGDGEVKDGQSAVVGRCFGRHFFEICCPEMTVHKSVGFD